MLLMSIRWRGSGLQDIPTSCGFRLTKDRTSSYRGEVWCAMATAFRSARTPHPHQPLRASPFRGADDGMEGRDNFQTRFIKAVGALKVPHLPACTGGLTQRAVIFPRSSRSLPRPSLKTSSLTLHTWGTDSGAGGIDRSSDRESRATAAGR